MRCRARRPASCSASGCARTRSGYPMPDPQPRQLITTLYGLYARDELWLSVASLVDLMADLDIDATAVRSSVSRLKKRDVLRSDKRDGRVGYALSPQTVETLRDGDHRIFEQSRATTDDGWLVAVFSVPESERAKRHALRTQLARLGFGSAAPGVWVAPGTLFDETRRVLERLGLSEYTEFFRGPYLGAGDVATRVGQWWDLDEIDALYRDFIGAYEPVLATVTAQQEPDPRSAYRAYVPLLTAWRRLPYLDPGLPLAYLPDAWSGIAAGKLFTELDDRLRPAAERHAYAVLAG